MNFLQLVQRTRQEVGYSGSGPASVAAQAGVFAKIVDWVKTAWLDVQRESISWRFGWASSTVSLAAGQASYDPVGEWGLAIRFIADHAIYITNPANAGAKYFVQMVAWPEYRMLPNSPAIVGLPSTCSRAPDGRLHFFPAPFAGLFLTIEYTRSPQVLEENLDVPRMPDEYHMAIVWRAVVLACAHDENVPLMQIANANYKSIIGSMRITEEPGFTSAGPLA